MAYDQVHDGPRPDSALMGTFCGGKPPPVFITSAGSSIVLWYHSPVHVAESSFTFEWLEIPPGMNIF
jgi:hypothetical protein